MRLCTSEYTAGELFGPSLLAAEGCSYVLRGVGICGPGPQMPTPLLKSMLPQAAYSPRVVWRGRATARPRHTTRKTLRAAEGYEESGMETFASSIKGMTHSTSASPLHDQGAIFSC
jgi:hypothetical protein